MPKQVKGFLAFDGTFFETSAECERYEAMHSLITACESHGVNTDNFFELIHELNVQIKDYFNADSKCKTPSVKAKGHVEFPEPVVSFDEDDYPDSTRRDKDAPGFLEQQIGRRK